MAKSFRYQSFERLIKSAGIVTNLVLESLQKSKGKIDFKQANLNLGSGVSVIMPANPVQSDGSVNIMFQFRGGSSGLISKAGVNTVVVMADAGGIGGGPSRNLYGSTNFVNQSISSILKYVGSQIGKPVKLGKLGFSAWSGGYDPIHGILSENYGGAPLIKAPDYVGLFDGLHHSTKPNSSAMKTWERLAQEAENGNTKFVITHTAVDPGKYPSTTDTTNYLLQNLNLKRQPVNNWAGQFSIKPTSKAEKGNFSVYQLYDKPQPYTINGRTNIPGTSGYQHIEALRGMPDFWPKDWT